MLTIDNVTAELPGANQTMASSVATPLERLLDYFAGLANVSPTSTLGTQSQFDLGNISGGRTFKGNARPARHCRRALLNQPI
jgi:hypothetical protein